MAKKYFIKIFSFFIFPASVFFFSLFIDYALGVYDVFPWVDIPMHFLGGVAVGYMFFLFIRLFREKGFIRIENRILFIIVIVALVSLIAVLWEFYEFIMVSYFGFPWQEEIGNTMLDLFMGMCGGLSVGIFSKI
ncbi:MAG: hypothetical protein ABIA78_00395 [archaeon]